MERKPNTKKLPQRASVKAFVHEFFSKEKEDKRKKYTQERILKFA